MYSFGRGGNGGVTDKMDWYLFLLFPSNHVTNITNFLKQM